MLALILASSLIALGLLGTLLPILPGTVFAFAGIVMHKAAPRGNLGILGIRRYRLWNYPAHARYRCLVHLVGGPALWCIVEGGPRSRSRRPIRIDFLQSSGPDPRPDRGRRHLRIARKPVWSGCRPGRGRNDRRHTGRLHPQDRPDNRHGSELLSRPRPLVIVAPMHHHRVTIPFR